MTEKAYPTKKETAQKTDENSPDKMELKVGKILEANKHPDADTLCVLKIDVGNSETRLIVSNLMTYYKLDELVNTNVVVLTNMKASKIRGVESEGLVLCAFNENKYEPLKVPSESNVGDRIFIEGYNNTVAEVAQLNPKKKVWDKIQSELKTNSDGECVWREFNMLTISGERISSSLINCNVK